MFSFQENAIKEGKLKFGEKLKPHMSIDVEPLQVVEAHYAKPSSINMVEVTRDYTREVVMVEAEGFAKGITEDSTQMLTTTETIDGFVHVDNMTKTIEGLAVKLHNLGITADAGVKVNMVKVSEEIGLEVDEGAKRQEEYNKVVFPKQTKILLVFLYR